MSVASASLIEPQKLFKGSGSQIFQRQYEGRSVLVIQNMSHLFLLEKLFKREYGNKT